MRNSCSDNIYYKQKRLLEEEEDLRDRINNFYASKSKLCEEIEKEKQDDLSKEILEVEVKIKLCDPFRGFLIPDENGSRRKDSFLNGGEGNVKVCKFHRKGFCKNKLLCPFFHSKSDCKEHIESKNCTNTDCTSRHREPCKFFNSKKGCERGKGCAFIHNNINDLGTNKEKEAQINALENLIKTMKNVMITKDVEIEKNRKELGKLKLELELKVAEIKEKEEIINTMKKEDEGTSEESDEDEEIDQDNRKDQHMLIGRGHFGKLFEIREGMEDEAESLRKEWRSNLKRK